MQTRNLKTAWMNIDEADEPRQFVSQMDRARGGSDDEPSQYKFVRSFLKLAEGKRVLDVGCGTGGAVRVFANVVRGNGKAVGLDCSQTMITEAKKRSAKLNLPVEFRKGDAHHLPFPDNSFDCSFSLRVFEIIRDPAQALKEMLRVTRPGGRVFVNGPDIDAWTFDVPDRRVTRKLLHYLCDSEVNGWIGRQLPRIFAEAGFSNIKVISHIYFHNDFDVIFDLFLKDILGRAQVAGVIQPRVAKQWTNALGERCYAGPFACGQALFRVVGTKV